jgi:hypothetical protein
MNTPKEPKPVKRHKFSRPRHFGSYHGSIPADYLIRIGEVVKVWPSVESAACSVFGIVLGLGGDNAEIVWNSLSTNQLKLKVMNEVLQKSRVHGSKHDSSTKSQYHEVLLKPLPHTTESVLIEFDSLNDMRNRIIHHRWWVSAENGKVYLSDPKDIHQEKQYAKITIQEIDRFLWRCSRFIFSAPLLDIVSFEMPQPLP